MIYLLLTLIFVAIGVYIVKKTSKHDTQQSEQPIHFDLLDDNGDPLPEQSSEPIIRELRYFCTKDSGYYVSVWPKNKKIPDYLEFEIAGMSFRDNIGNYAGEHAGTLEEEPDNEYDASAIKILADDGHHVGYVPKDMTQAVRDFTNLPCNCYFYIGRSDDGTYYSDCYINR